MATVKQKMPPQKGRISDAKHDGYSRYCGPTSLSVITGKGTEEICKSLRSMFYRNAIRRMYNAEMLQYLEQEGYSVDLVYSAARGSNEFFAGRALTPPTGLPMTLKRWHDQNARSRDVYLVQVTGHYVVVADGQIACTSNSGRLQPFNECRSVRKQVKNVWRVS